MANTERKIMEKVHWLTALLLHSAFRKKKSNSMRYVTEPERPLLFMVLLCHGKLTAGQQDYSYIKLQISQEKPLGLSIGFYFFGAMGSIACVLR